MSEISPQDDACKQMGKVIKAFNTAKAALIAKFKASGIQDIQKPETEDFVTEYMASEMV